MKKPILVIPMIFSAIWCLAQSYSPNGPAGANVAEQWRFDRLKDENGNLYSSYFINAIKQADANGQSSIRSGGLGLQWQEMGPDNIGGRTRAILIDKRDSSNNTVYAGAVSGGMWKSTDGANTWKRLTSWNQWMAIASIVQGPAPDYIIYIGTGEGLINIGGSSYNSGSMGNGIFKLDANDNPIRITPDVLSQDIMNLDSAWVAVNRIAVNPANGAQIIAATYMGLYQSMDTGNTWSPVQLTGNLHSFIGVMADDVAWSVDGHHIYASLGDYFSGTLVTFNDTGATWVGISSSANPGFPTGALGRIEIAVAPSDPNVIYVLVANTDAGCTKGVYRSVDAGNTWQTIAAGGPTFQLFEIGGGCQGWFDNVITVSPGDADKFYMGGASFYTGSIESGVTLADSAFTAPTNSYYLPPGKHCITIASSDSNLMYIGTDNGIYKSVNAIVDFPFPTYTSQNLGYNVVQNYGIASGIQGDLLGGTQDAGTTWINFRGTDPMAAEQVIGWNGTDGILNGISHIAPAFYFGGFYFGGLERSADYCDTFNTFFDYKIDPLNEGGPTVCNGNFLSGDAAFITPLILAETKTAAHGLSTVPFVADTSYSSGSVITLNSTTANYPFQVTLSSALSSGDTLMVQDPVRSRIFMSTYCGVWLTSDALNVNRVPRWFGLSGNTLIGDAESFAASADGDVLYVGTEAGYVYKFPNMNAHCDTARYTVDTVPDILYSSTSEYSSSPVALNRPLEGIAVDPQNNNHIVVTVAGFSTNASSPHVYESTDGGTTWKADTAGLPNMPVYTVVIHDSTTIIIGSELGIWSRDGTSWHEENNGYLGNGTDGYPRMPTYRMVESNLYTDGCPVLYVGSFGRGMWRSTTLTPVSCRTSVAVNDIKGTGSNGLNIFPNPVSGSAKITLTLDKKATVTLKVFDITGRLCKQIGTKNALPGENLFDLDATGLNSGTYILVATGAGTGKLSKLFVVTK